MKFYEFMVDPKLGNMGAASWRVWHIVARILDGDFTKLSRADKSLAEQITQRTRFPSQPITDFYGGPSRRSGKSRFLQVRMAWRLSLDYRDRLAPGEQAVVAATSPTTDQSAILTNYVSATVTASRLMAAQLERETASEMFFKHRTALKIYAGSFRSTRGPTYAGVYIDEASFLRSEDSANPDVELIRAVTPGLMTLNGDLFVTSSPYMKRGAMYDAYRKHFGNNDSDALYVAGPSELFNPTLDSKRIAKQRAEDPESAKAEWDGEHRSDLSAPFADLVDNVVDAGVTERPYRVTTANGAHTVYVAFSDPAGGSGRDSWSTRIVHVEDALIQDDALLEIRPPFNTGEAARQVAAFLKSYGITSVTGDRYAGAWPRDALATHGVSYMESPDAKSDIYRECVPLFSTARVRLLEHPRTLTQLRQIERRVRAGGRDSFDHAPGGNDDNANALCGALLAASRALLHEDSQEIFVAESDFFTGYIENDGRYLRS